MSDHARQCAELVAGALGDAARLFEINGELIHDYGSRQDVKVSLRHQDAAAKALQLYLIVYEGTVTISLPGGMELPFREKDMWQTLANEAVRQLSIALSGPEEEAPAGTDVIQLLHNMSETEQTARRRAVRAAQRDGDKMREEWAKVYHDLRITCLGDVLGNILIEEVT